MTAKVLKQIFSELRHANVNFNPKSSKLHKFELDSLQAPLQDGELMHKMFGKTPRQVEHITSCYAAYLRSTRLLSELQERFAGREKTIEESARLVGLELPKKNF